MKLILDEWIVREVIDTLYMARTTLLGITGLDSPQDVEKKSANETAITRRISKAIDIIQQSEQLPLQKDLEEAANVYSNCYTDPNGALARASKRAYIAGAKWQKEQDDKEKADLFTIVALDAAQRVKEQMMKDGNVILSEEDFEAEKEKSMEWGYNLCKEQMLKEAVEAKFISMDEATIKYSPLFTRKLKQAFRPSDKVRIIIVKEDEK